jgi:SAM-dependent methyltransferase
MWDERYNAEGYAYGTEPNSFLVEAAGRLPRGGRILSLAEGEGRNAVYLARQGWQVTAVDGSRVGLDKGRRLAELHGVSVNWVHADLADFALAAPEGGAGWHGIVSIFCPLPSALRRRIHAQVEAALAPGGVFLLEAYTPAQAGRGTGGGNDRDTMQTAQSLRDELPGLRFEHLQELEREVIEGRFHTGAGAVVQAVAVKPVKTVKP